ncbi:MAG: thiamine phosphate synthase [Planctomycetales bacterium]|nr:thiamine phosphate synthase [Planctomycetales bacterium]
MLKQKTEFFRVLDANGNRAAEGFRVVEDYARFILDDRILSSKCKQLRHSLCECLQSPSLDGMVMLRDASADVGRTISTELEYERSDAASIAKANLARVQQAMRSLEEYSKPIDANLAQRCEQLRYQAYELELALLAAGNGMAKLQNSLLYVLIDVAGTESEFRERVARIISQPGHLRADIVQIRDKNASTRELIERCQIFRETAADSDTMLIVNDRPDIARIAHADGVHLGQDDMTIHQARTIVGVDCLIGVSTHNVGQVEAAIASGANYIGVGPTFRSSTKQFDAFTGVELLQSVSEMTSIPAFAIGGIHENNLDAVIQAGFHRVAVSAAISQADYPSDVAARIRNKLQSARDSGGAAK